MLVVPLAFLAVICTAPLSTSQIMHHVVATIPHQFVVANTTLPAGKYEFRMLPDTDLTVMTCTSVDGSDAVGASDAQCGADARLPDPAELAGANGSRP